MKLKSFLIVVFCSIKMFSQTTIEQLNLMPWPQNIQLETGIFKLDKNFKINISGEADERIFIGATNFLRRLDGRTGLFFNQGFITKSNQEPTAQLQISCQRKGIIGINEEERYSIGIASDKINIIFSIMGISF